MKYPNKVTCVGDWVIHRYGPMVWENWANDGFCLEGKRLSKNPGIWIRLLWKLHFFKPYIILKYGLGVNNE